MAKKTNQEEVQQLIDIGKEKGFLTYDEVNDMLPANMVSSEQLEDVMSMFGEMDIEIVDSDSKVSSSKDEDLDDEDEGEVELEAGTLGRTSDPVRMYLREMGQVALLTREGEVEIAKRIEEGEALVTKVVMRTPIAAREVLSLLEKLEKGQIGVSDITRDYDDEEGGEAEGRQRERLMGLLEELRPLDQKMKEIQAELQQEPAAKKLEKLEKQQADTREQVLELLRQVRLKDFQVAKIVDRLKEMGNQVKKGQAEIGDCEQKVNRPPCGNQRLSDPHAHQRGRSHGRGPANSMWPAMCCFRWRSACRRQNVNSNGSRKNLASNPMSCLNTSKKFTKGNGSPRRPKRN